MTYDYDVVVIGSGFGGSVAALRLTEKGYRVAVLDMGRRWAPATSAQQLACPQGHVGAETGLLRSATADGAG